MSYIQIPMLDELAEQLRRIEAKLDSLAPEERLWTTRDVADFLSVTEETVRVKVRAGEIPVAQRAGNRMRFDPSAIKSLRQ
jgi:excisionase family DNA binding protein